MCEQLEGLGVTLNELKPGVTVMVPAGRLAAAANGHPCIIATATVMGRASQKDTENHTETFKSNPAGVWWLNVHMAPGASLPQMYRADEILGVPAYGLAMPAGLDAAAAG